MSAYTPMIQQYLEIKNKYKDAFLFFRLGDFYEMFFEDAETASKLLEITLTSRDGGKDQKIPMCGVPYHSAESYISKLIDNGYKVAICEQVEDPKTAKGVVKREVVRVITPGTVMEGRKIEENNNNYIASISLWNDHFGLSLSDISTGEFYTTEIRGETEELLTEISQYQPSEVLVSKPAYATYHSILKQLQSTITVIEEDVCTKEEEARIIQDQFQHVDITKLPKTIKSSVAQLLLYLKETQQKQLIHFNHLRWYDAKRYMVLDLYSKRNLELIKTSRDQTKKGSLIWLLDQTETAMGSRLLRRWLEKPLLSKEAIEERLNGIEELVDDPILLEDLRSELKQIYDIERIVSRVAYGNASPKDLSALKGSLEKVPNIYHVINNSNATSLKKYFSEVDMCQDIAAYISSRRSWKTRLYR